MTRGTHLLRSGRAACLVAALALGGCGGTTNPDEPTTDTTPPTIVSHGPVNGAKNVGTTSPVVVDFSEAMDPASITTSTFFVMPSPSGAAAAGTINVTNASATFTPAGLAPTTQYVVTVLGGASGVKDVAGNALFATYTFTFTTGTGVDTTPPVVSSISPANGATGVAVAAPVVVTFSEAVQSASINTTTFQLVTSIGSNVVGGTVSSGGDTATFTPVVRLAPLTQYTALVAGGTSGVKDLAGNAMSTDFIFSFTTAADTTAPTVIATGPGGGATGVGTNSTVAVTFSEPMAGATITTGTVKLATTAGGTPVSGAVGASGTWASFAPAAALAPSTQYTLTVTGGTAGVTDLAGNALAGDYTFDFTTGSGRDTTAPAVSSTVPAASATGVARTTTVSVTFNEPMSPASLATAAFSLVPSAGGAPISGDVVTAGQTVTFTPAVVLAPNTSYTATVASGASDLAGNALGAPYSFSFTTGP